MQFSNVNVKIDTGCPKTSFPILKLGISEENAYEMKKKDCNNDLIAKRISFGVNDSRIKIEEDKRKFKSKRFMELNSISFKHNAINFSLENLFLGNFQISVSYDRTGNILIGMDILRTLEIYIGTTITNETVLLACKDNSELFLQEVAKLQNSRKII